MSRRNHTLVALFKTIVTIVVSLADGLIGSFDITVDFGETISMVRIGCLTVTL